MADSENFINLEECRGHKRGEYQRKKFWILLFPYVPLFGDKCCFHPESYWLSEAVGLLPQECLNIVSLNFWGTICFRDCEPCNLKIRRFYPGILNLVVQLTQVLWKGVFSFWNTCMCRHLFFTTKTECLSMAIQAFYCVGWLFTKILSVLCILLGLLSEEADHVPWWAHWPPELRLSGLSLCDLIPDDCAIEKSWFRISLTERIVNLKFSCYCWCHWGKSSVWTSGKATNWQCWRSNLEFNM